MISKRNGGLWLAIPVLMLMGAEATVASPGVMCPKKSDFTLAAAETLFQYRADPAYRVTDPACIYSATHTVTDTDGTEYPDHSFVVGANPGDKTWRYAGYLEDERTSSLPAGVSLAGRDELLRLAGDIMLPISESYSPSVVEPSLSTVVAEYDDVAPEAVDVVEAYFAMASASENDHAAAQEAMNILLASSSVSIDCTTLSNRLKYKSPACDGGTGIYELIGCQFNYDDSVAVKNRGITRVVFYRAGHRGDPAHALASQTYLCNDTSDRGELKSWFSTPAFRQICRREDVDIPYQTVAASCQ